MVRTQFNIGQMRRFGGLSDEQAALLADMKPALEKHGPGLVDRFYANLDEHAELKDLLDATPGRREALGKHLLVWLTSLTTGTYDDAYLSRRYQIGVRHVEVGLEPRWVIGAMSFCRSQIAGIVDAEYADAPDKVDRFLALDKVMDLDLNIMLQSYDDERMNLFLETTGFSKELFESMIMAAG